MTIWILSDDLDLLSTNCFSPSGERVSLRADLRQSQSGSSSLSPGAYRGEATTAGLAISEILPITSVRAPRYYTGRSLRARRVDCERWQDRSVASEHRDPVAESPPGGKRRRTSGCLDALLLGSPPAGSSRPLTWPTKWPRERNRERRAGGAGGGNERPCSPARGGRNPRPGWPQKPTDPSPTRGHPQFLCGPSYIIPLGDVDHSSTFDGSLPAMSRTADRPRRLPIRPNNRRGWNSSFPTPT